jgi:hypothetical protein
MNVAVALPSATVVTDAGEIVPMPLEATENSTCAPETLADPFIAKTVIVDWSRPLFATSQSLFLLLVMLDVVGSTVATTKPTSSSTPSTTQIVRSIIITIPFDEGDMGRLNIYNFLFLKLRYYWSELKKTTFFKDIGQLPSSHCGIGTGGAPAAWTVAQIPEEGLCAAGKHPGSGFLSIEQKKILLLEAYLIAGVLFFPDTL